MNRPSALVLCSLLTAPAAGLALRADVQEAEYLELGQGFPAVAQIAGLASGTLIAPDWVLTVAHAPEMLERMRPDATLEVQLGDHSYEVARVVVPEARAKSPRMHDIALLQLAAPVPAQIAPLAISTSQPAAEDEILIAGWGILASGDVGVEMSPALMQSQTRDLRAGWNVVERIDADMKQMIARFDPPATAVELEASPCVGDSGGPALVRVKGESGEPTTWQVAGVIANIDDIDEDGVLGEYGDEFGMTLVAEYAEWIRATIGE